MHDGLDVSGRVDECEAQAKAWLALGRRDEVESELRQLIQTSFGVGSRKDYQMESWVNWLLTVLPMERHLVPERVALFAAAIAGTKATTEGRGTTSAALTLIEGCIGISPGLATRLATFFEKHGCVDHSDAVDALLRVALDSRLCRPSVAEAVFTHFLSLFSADDHAALAGGVLRALGQEKQKKDLTDACSRMVGAIRVQMVPSKRPATLRQIKSVAVELGLDLDKCNVTSIPEPSRDQYHDAAPLTPEDDSKSNERESESKALTLGGFLAMVAAKRDGFPSFGAVLDKLLPTLSLPDTRSLATGIRESLDDAVSLAKVSLRLTEQGDRRLAWEIGQIALSRSQPYGWVRHGDGGTRLWAARALVAANPESGRSIAISKFAEDISAGVAYPAQAAQGLSEIVPLFVQRLPTAELYSVIEDHVRKLAHPLPLLDEVTLVLSLPADGDTIEQAICGVMAHHLVEFVPLLAQAAASVLCRLLQLGSAAAEGAVLRLLSGCDGEKVAAVELLDVLAVKWVGLLRPYESALRALADDPNYWVSLTVRKLCERLQVNDLGGRPRRALPTIYLLSLPPTSESKGPVALDEPLPGSDGPRDLVRPYDLQLGILSELGGLDDESVIARTASLMRQIAPAGSLTAEAEREYRQQLQRAGLELPYRRLRGAYAREAMQQVAGELVDGGCIEASELPTVERVIRFSDPMLANVSPVERPPQVASLGGITRFRADDAEHWVVHPPRAWPEHLRVLGDRLVVGEFSELRLLGHRSLRESRISFVGEKGRGIEGVYRAFGKIPAAVVSEYPNIPISDKVAPLLILQNSTYGFDTLGSDWLCLNPIAARALDWQPAAEGLFRWVSAKGDVMAETIWWKDGRLEQYGGDGEVGEGWIVAASEAGFKAISSLLKRPVRTFGIQRSRGEGDERVEGPLLFHEESVP